MFQRIIHTSVTRSYFFIRLMVGCVFLSEGIQKILYPSLRGGGRFEKIGFSNPDFWGNFVAGIEVVCGLLILIGLFTRIAAILTGVIMIVAIITTKFKIFTIDGFWVMAHAARTDWAMLLGSLFLFMKGAGRWSLDFLIKSKSKSKS